MIKVGSDFSGVGAFDQALLRLGIDYQTVFACDMDKYARMTYIANYGNPVYYPENVYDREIPSESLDIYMTSPPCQAFSLAGKRKGEDDKRGVLFYNSHEFIVKNKPRYFIFENVKGLLSDDSGKTFQRWLDYLGGKSVNGNPVIFPLEEAVPYHIYWQVLNAKDFGVPQNRERVFIIGIRDDEDNSFSFPRPFHLEKRLKDVLEKEVDQKYFLSDKMLNYLQTTMFSQDANKIKNDTDVANCLTSTDYKSPQSIKIIGNTNPSGNGMNGNVFDDRGISPTLSTNKGEGIKIKSATSKGYEIATDEDSINFSVPNSETRRGRVGKGVAQTLDTAFNQAIMVIKHQRTEEAKAKRKKSLLKGKDSGSFADREMIAVNQEVSDTILANPNPQKEGLILDVKIGAIRGRNPENPLSRDAGLPTEQRLEINENGTSNALTTVQKDNVVVFGNLKGGKWDKTHEQSGRVYDINGIGATLHTMAGGNQHPKIAVKDNEIIVLNDATHSQQRIYSKEGIAPTLSAGSNGGGQNPCKHLTSDYKIRRLTPRECFRLMDFPDTFNFSVVSNSQAYKQAGNSIVVGVLCELIKKLNW